MRLRPVIAVLALAFAMSTTAAPKVEKPKQRWQPAHVIVKYKAGFAPAVEKQGVKSAKKVFGTFKLKGKAKQQADRRGLDRVYLLELKKDNVEEAVAALNADPSVEYAEPNWVLSLPAVPNDPSFGVQWGLQTIGAPAAWDTTTNGAGVVVGVVDSGIELTHPDLVANVWTNPGEVAGNGIDDDGNGFVDDIHGWNFADDLADPTDLAGHGTRVAGVIAATGNNATQVTGVAWTAKLAALKIGDSLIYVEAAVQAVEYANMMGFRITTNSWGWNEGGQSFLLDDVVAAAEAAGHLFIAGAGNDGHDNDQTPFYPSHYTHPNVISVTATTESDTLAWFSNYGFSSVDLAAPGTNIDTTSLGGTHVTASGTSFATPFVAGAAALYWTANPSLTPAQVRDALMLRSDPLPSLHGRTVSGGRLNIANLFDSDAVAPNAIGDLTVVNTSHRSVTIRFTATGDDGAAGRAARYDVRVSAAPITAANFDSATPLIREPQPQTPGTLELFKLSGLAPSSTYYLAVRALDNAGNASALSNVASFTTQRMAILFDDNVEAGSRWTVTGSDGIGGPALWRIASGPMSDTAAWNYNRDLDSGTSYDTGAPNWGALTSRNLDLTQARDTRLRFRQHVWTDRHLGEDLAQVQVSANGGAWTTLLAKQTTLYDMIGEELDLSAYDGQHIRIRFFIDTVDARRNSLPGWVLDDIVVDATSANAAASATIDALPSIVEDQPATLTATASDPEGAALEYKWSFGDGRFAYTTTPSVTHTWRREGSYNVTLVVYDGSTSSDTASVTAVPVPVNDRPVAALKMSAPPPYLENALIYLNDFHSTDEEGAPLIFHFDYGDGSTYTTSPGMVVPHTWTTPGTYTITMTADDGAQLSLPVTLTIDIVEASNDKPVARISTSSSGVHPNENVTFDGSASTDEETAVVSYQWTFPDGSTASGPTVSKSFNSGAQNVTLTVMDQTGIASTAATTEVRVCGGADAHLFARTRFTCPGGTAALGIQVRSGFLPMTLTWSDGFVQQLTSTTNGLGERLVTPSADTTYSLVSMTDFLGCAGTVNTTPLQVQLASATLAASTIKNCPGQPTQLNPQLKGDGPWTLTWSDGYVQQIPLQGDARRIVTPAATTTYSIASATCASCPTGTTAVVSGSVTVETMEPLSATVTGGGISCNGSGAPVTVTISGGEPPFLVYWTNMGAMSTSSRTVTAYFSPSTVTTYTPRVTSGACSVTAAGSATVTPWNGTPPSVTSVTGGGSFCSGQSATITASLAGDGLPFTLTWSDGFVQMVDATTATRTVSPATTTTYSVKSIRNSSGCTGTTSGSATVHNAAAAHATVSGGGSICTPATTATVSIKATLSGVAPFSVTWSDGVTQTLAANAGNDLWRSVAPEATTTYTVTSVTDSRCGTGTSSGSATVTAKAKPAALLSGGGAFCSGGSATIGVQLTGTAPFTVTWNDGLEQTINANTASRQVAPASTQSYSITSMRDANSNCTNSSNSVSAWPVEVPTAEVSGGGGYCPGAGRELSAWVTGRGAVTITWSDGFSQTAPAPPQRVYRQAVPAGGTVTYTISSVAGQLCSGTSSGSATLTPLTPPSAVVSGGGSFCEGASTTLTATLTGSGPFTVTWSDGVAQSVSNGNVASRQVSPATQTVYTATVRDFSSCTVAATGSATATPIRKPVISTQPQNKTIAKGTSTTLTVTTTESGLSYQWYQGASGTTTLPVGTNSPTFTTPKLRATAQYWVKIWKPACASYPAHSATATVTAQ